MPKAFLVRHRHGTRPHPWKRADTSEKSPEFVDQDLKAADDGHHQTLSKTDAVCWEDGDSNSKKGEDIAGDTEPLGQREPGGFGGIKREEERHGAEEGREGLTAGKEENKEDEASSSVQEEGGPDGERSASPGPSLVNSSWHKSVEMRQDTLRHEQNAVLHQDGGHYPPHVAHNFALRFFPTQPTGVKQPENGDATPGPGPLQSTSQVIVPPLPVFLPLPAQQQVSSRLSPPSAFTTTSACPSSAVTKDSRNHGSSPATKHFGAVTSPNYLQPPVTTSSSLTSSSSSPPSPLSSLSTSSSTSAENVTATLTSSKLACNAGPATTNLPPALPRNALAATSSSSTGSTTQRSAAVPTSLPRLLTPFPSLTPGQTPNPLLPKDRFPFSCPTSTAAAAISSLPLSPSDPFYPPLHLPPPPPSHASGHSHPHHRVFGYPPAIMRPLPSSSGLSCWPLQPVPLRVPMCLRPDFGVMSPEEIPSPPGCAVADMPTSPIVGVRSPRLDSIRQLAGVCVGAVDINNNNNSGSSNSSSNNCGGLVVGGGGEDVGRGQSFKDFLESAKVRVETINDGNGLKNPLLSAENTRLSVENGPLSFMTLDAFPACPVCGIKCDTPRLLQRHVRSHKEIKRYLCAWCGKGFNDTFDLKRHTRTHTGVRPYKCESCGKAFTQRCSLESHSRKIHGDTLPFSFNERRAKLYVCEDCGHSTSSIENHFRHLRAQHPGHPALGRPHHDRRQYKFSGKDCEEEGEGEYREMVEGEEEGKREDEEETGETGCGGEAREAGSYRHSHQDLQATAR